MYCYHGDVFVSSSSEATEEQPPTQPAVAPTVIQPATAQADSLIGDLLSLDLPTAAPPTQYDQSTTGQCVHYVLCGEFLVVG